MDKALKKFQKMNSRMPERLIIFRDGVGDKQLRAISEQEITQIKSALKELGLAEKVGFIYVSVCKRINTRIFASGELEDSYKNPVPGLVVNSAITEKEPAYKEFYLVSTSSRQGMTKPTRYTIAYDSLGAPQEYLELLTYKLCHSYFNVAGSISVPAPVQYAHKLAAMVGDRAGGTAAAFTRDGTMITTGTQPGLPPVMHERFEELPGLYYI